MKSLYIYIIGVLSALALYFLLDSKGVLPRKRVYITSTDTIYIDKPYKEIEIKRVEVPVRVTLYKTDTIYRQRIEKDTLISAIEITPWMAKVHTLSPIGVSSIKHYPLHDAQKLRINHKGQIQIEKPKKHKRKNRLRTLTYISLFLGGCILAS